MKIYTLGTSHGRTEIGRDCSGTLLEVNGTYYLFDCGGDVEGKMTNLELPIVNLKSVFVSHMHEDHAGSLTSIMKLFVTYISKGEPVEFFLPEQNGIDALKNWFTALHGRANGSQLKYTEIKSGEIYSDKNITVTAIPTAHIANGAFPSFAFDVKAGDKRLLYTGDLSADFHDFPSVVSQEKFDVVISEGTHFDLYSNLDTINKTLTDKFIFTHLYPTQEAAIKENLQKFPFPTFVANDNECFEF